MSFPVTFTHRFSINKNDDSKFPEQISISIPFLPFSVTGKITLKSLKQNQYLKVEYNHSYTISTIICILVAGLLLSNFSVFQFIVFGFVVSIVVYFLIAQFCIQQTRIKLNLNNHSNGIHIIDQQSEWIQNPEKCPACGHKITLHDRFCPNCGLNLR